MHLCMLFGRKIFRPYKLVSFFMTLHMLRVKLMELKNGSKIACVMMQDGNENRQNLHLGIIIISVCEFTEVKRAN